MEDVVDDGKKGSDDGLKTFPEGGERDMKRWLFRKNEKL